jgi:hypothetical protein
MKRWRERPIIARVFFLSANLAACLMIWVCIVMPTSAFFTERNARIAEQRALLVRLTSVAIQEGAVQSIGHQVGAQRGDFLVGSSDGVVNANLQTQLKRMAEGAGARVRSLQGLPAMTSEQVRYSGSRVEISGPIQSVHRAIYEIESAKPFLFVTVAQIRALPPTISPSGQAEEPVLQAQLDVFGAVQIEERTP